LARRTRNTNPQANIGPASQSTFTSPDEHLDISMLEIWLWDAACAIRGSTDAPKFKDFILPLVFFKRLSDVLDDEFAAHVKEYGDEATAREIIEADLAHALKTATTPIIRFYIPKEYNWKAIRNHGADGRLGEFITGAMREVAKLNPNLQGVLDIKDYNERQSGSSDFFLRL
jgi:type I restriction enzyme M protein